MTIDNGYLEQLDAAVADLTTEVPHSASIPAELVDICGHVLRLEQKLGKWRRDLLDSLADDVELGFDDFIGNEYELVESRAATRTYHTPAILGRLTRALDADPLAAIKAAEHGKALSLTWRWTQLERLSTALGFKLTRAVGQADPDNDDLDAPMVMEEWTSKRRLIGRKGEETE